MTNHDKGIDGRLARLADEITDVRDTHRELVTERDKLIIRLDELGYSKTDIAAVSGITYQQVQQIIGRNK